MPELGTFAGFFNAVFPINFGPELGFIIMTLMLVGFIIMTLVTHVSAVKGEYLIIHLIYR